MVASHAVLRTRYEVSGELVAVVEPSATCPVERFDIGPIDEAARELAFSARLLEVAQHRFDLRRAPLIRVGLVRATSDDHGLVICVHHLAFDGWSSGLLVHEVFARYDAHVAGTPRPLVVPAVAYADYAAHQARAASGARHAKAMTFWRKRLAGAAPALSLPVDHPSDRPVGYAGAQLVAVIGPERTAAMHQVARDHGATPFMVLLAALHATMLAWTGARDQVIGAVTANRGQAGFQDVIGCFLDFLPMRIELAGDDTGTSLLERVRIAVIDALRNRECSINEMATALAPRTGRAKSPFYNVGLLVPYDKPVCTSASLTISELPFEVRHAELDLRVIPRVAEE